MGFNVESVLGVVAPSATVSAQQTAPTASTPKDKGGNAGVHAPLAGWRRDDRPRDL